ncbi:MAG: acylneuraminate cytidylyltransferase family protein [archaeon]
MIVAIIPARGDSKGIPKKNIIDCAGQPLISWSIQHAKNSKLVGGVYVSTDCEDIASVSREHGAEVIWRPSEHATDTASSEAALLHALEVIEKEKKVSVDAVLFLQATSPIRDDEDIDNAIRKFMEEKADSLFSCSQIKDHFTWEYKDGSYVSVNYDHKSRKPRQKIKNRYLENGSIYIFKPELLKKEKNRLGGKIAIYEMDSSKSIQIDEPDDIVICEYHIKKLRERKDSNGK